MTPKQQAVIDAAKAMHKATSAEPWYAEAAGDAMKALLAAINALEEEEAEQADSNVRVRCALWATADAWEDQDKQGGVVECEELSEVKR